MEHSPRDCDWFSDEVTRVLPELYATALRLARNSADAEDLVASAVARAWDRLGQLEDRAHLRGWLFRILTRLFISECRARAARPVLEPLAEEPATSDFSLFEKLHQPFLLWWGNPEQEFLDRLLREDLERAVDRLPDAYRVVLTLADLQGLTYREIADTLQIPIGTVRSRLARARSLLQQALWKHAADAGLVATEPPVQPKELA